MTANDFQILIAPVIGTAAAMAIGWLSLFLVLRREKQLERLRATSRTNSGAGSSAKSKPPLGKERHAEPLAGV